MQIIWCGLGFRFVVAVGQLPDLDGAHIVCLGDSCPAFGFGGGLGTEVD